MKLTHLRKNSWKSLILICPSTVKNMTTMLVGWKASLPIPFSRKLCRSSKKSSKLLHNKGIYPRRYLLQFIPKTPIRWIIKLSCNSKFNKFNSSRIHKAICNFRITRWVQPPPKDSTVATTNNKCRWWTTSSNRTIAFITKCKCNNCNSFKRCSMETVFNTKCTCSNRISSSRLGKWMAICSRMKL